MMSVAWVRSKMIVIPNLRAAGDRLQIYNNYGIIECPEETDLSSKFLRIKEIRSHIWI